ncbi:uncharacterized protein KGF55_004046 [Candida pseudojiufengensis]|uniref:uncharacterized protein n=1 Tax=Candida pseudojiufengensis TaxID=497109 RepID=UPI002224516B|nr:uncharacterized protein KGF55_004046 [Candida pseudojiufengensis]KAI5961423.1 hypothetical protein KGF55_004046 [Candida pseudojiufengensis]
MSIAGLFIFVILSIVLIWVLRKIYQEINDFRLFFNDTTSLKEQLDNLQQSGNSPTAHTIGGTDAAGQEFVTWEPASHSSALDSFGLKERNIELEILAPDEDGDGTKMRQEYLTKLYQENQEKLGKLTQEYRDMQIICIIGLIGMAVGLILMMSAFYLGGALDM